MMTDPSPRDRPLSCHYAALENESLLHVQARRPVLPAGPGDLRLRRLSASAALARRPLHRPGAGGATVLLCS